MTAKIDLVQYDGPYPTGTNFSRQIYILAVALSDLPDMPLDAASLSPYVLPLDPTPINWVNDGGVTTMPGMTVLYGVVTFTTGGVAIASPIKAIALLSLPDSTAAPWLISLASPVSVDPAKDFLQLTVQAIAFETIPE